MTFPLADFRVLYPAFEAVSDSVVGTVAESAKCWIPSSCVDCSDQLWMLATAHLLKLRSDAAQGTAATGAMQSATVGSVSVTMAQPTGGRTEQAQWFSMTPYGVQFLALRRTCAGLPRYVNGSGASLPWR